MFWVYFCLIANAFDMLTIIFSGMGEVVTLHYSNAVCMCLLSYLPAYCNVIK